MPYSRLMRASARAMCRHAAEEPHATPRRHAARARKDARGAPFAKGDAERLRAKDRRAAPARAPAAVGVRQPR